MLFFSPKRRSRSMWKFQKRGERILMCENGFIKQIFTQMSIMIFLLFVIFFLFCKLCHSGLVSCGLPFVQFIMSICLDSWVSDIKASSPGQQLPRDIAGGWQQFLHKFTNPDKYSPIMQRVVALKTNTTRWQLIVFHLESSTNARTRRLN